MSFASIWGFTSKMALVIIKRKNRISRPADNFHVKKGCIREACVLIPSVPEFCHFFPASSSAAAHLPRSFLESYPKVTIFFIQFYCDEIH